MLVFYTNFRYAVRRQWKFYFSQTSDKILKCETLWNFIFQKFRVIGKNKFLDAAKLP
jgi:hypothetical protein